MIKKVLFSEEQIKERVISLAREINEYYDGKEVVVVPLLRGGVVFASDLIRELDFPVQLDFMTTSSYGNSEVSSGSVNILSELRINIKNKHVLIVDDIIDTGNTLKHVLTHLKSKEPASLKLCTMLDKPSRRIADVEGDFIGYKIDDLFVVGYGLDYQGFYRNSPYIFVFERDDDGK